MSRTTKVPMNAATVSGSGGRGIKSQGVKSGKGLPTTGTLKTANMGQGTKTYKGVSTRAQVTGLKKGGSSNVSGGGHGPHGKG